eukprot:gene15944-25023_t
MAYLRSSYLAAAGPDSGGIQGGSAWDKVLQDPQHVPSVMGIHGRPQNCKNPGGMGQWFCDGNANVDTCDNCGSPPESNPEGF